MSLCTAPGASPSPPRLSSAQRCSQRTWVGTVQGATGGPPAVPIRGGQTEPVPRKPASHPAAQVPSSKHSSVLQPQCHPRHRLGDISVLICICQVWSVSPWGFLPPEPPPRSCFYPSPSFVWGAAPVFPAITHCRLPPGNVSPLPTPRALSPSLSRSPVIIKQL